MTRYRLRSAFMMLGSFLGVLALILVGSIGEAAEDKIVETMRQIFGSSSILITAGGGVMMGGPRPASSRLKLDDIAAVARAVPGITAWDPQQAVRGAELRHEGAAASARVLGQSERGARVWDRGVSRGEYFDAAAVAGAARIAVIGETVAASLFGTQDPIGADLQINFVAFRVVGILERFGTDLHGMDRDNEVVVPISTAMRRLTNTDMISSARLLIADPARSEETAKQVANALRELHGLTSGEDEEPHGIASGQRDDFTVASPVQAQRMVGQAERIFFVFLPLIAGISLVAGGVVAATLMLVAVNERIAEIGLRRAVGARPADIRLQFLLESAVTTLGGGLLGLVAGVVISQVVASQMHLGDILPWRMVFLGILLSSATGLLAGVAPARRAARLQPIDALR
jgi:putative ABC transport system permease protein